MLTALTSEPCYRVGEGRLATNDNSLVQTIAAKSRCCAADHDRHAAQTVAP
jgi:hypothetical protein